MTAKGKPHNWAGEIPQGRRNPGQEGQPQIREQMSGPDLHVFTLKFLALKKWFFSCFWGQKKSKLCNFSVRTLECFQKN